MHYSWEDVKATLDQVRENWKPIVGGILIGGALGIGFRTWYWKVSPWDTQILIPGISIPYKPPSAAWIRRNGL